LKSVAWIAAVVAGVVVVIGVTAAIGNRDKSGKTVPAGEWAQTVCGTVGTWRGTMESIVEDVRTPPAKGQSGVEEPQSQTPQGRTGLVREGLKDSVRATKTLVEGVDNAGVPDTPHGDEAAQLVSSWASSSVSSLQQAQGSLEHEATTLEQALTQFADAAGAMRETLAGGVRTLVQVAALDPQLAAALLESSTCRQLRGEQSST
jgi:hypothetical protein